MILTALTANTQTTIKGSITDSTNLPLSGATVILDRDTGATANYQGEYTIYNVAKGEHIISISYVGYQTQKQKIVIDKESDITINIVLEQVSEELQTVEIFGRKEQGYKNTSSFLATKSATKLIDVPQSVGYVTKEVILDQAAFTLNDVVKNISGINQFAFYNDFTRVQGQRNSSILLNSSRLMSSFWKQQLIPHVERVEVIKGPASALFGNASPG
ncbi:MAG: carboxypeptidase-like regulatory domain-containing protein [Aestuariibaculum sp.]